MAIDDGRVISNFIVQAIGSSELTINGNGSQTRSFQYVDDLIQAMLKMMNSDNNFIGPVNIGNPNEISINKLALKIIELCKSDSKIILMIYLKMILKDESQILKWQSKFKLETSY